MTLILALVVAVLFTVGTYLILQRALIKIAMGLGVLAHGANLLLLLSGGRAGAPPLLARGGGSVVDEGGIAGFADPLPQAMALTAIVISFGVGGILLTIAYRSWRLHGNDEVEDDVEDRRIARLSQRGAADAGDDAEAAQ
ncbi:MAG TPA: NADH-quinone oxidoreductase subunit K [Egibacteraceae bacterium]|nr:NADH-quinone oxidoreductase subunit K [Egibacteraceae bacterium]